jgi:hypothetical protein
VIRFLLWVALDVVIILASLFFIGMAVATGFTFLLPVFITTLVMGMVGIVIQIEGEADALHHQ